MRCYTLSPVMRGEATHTFCLLSMCDAVSFLRQIKESMLGSRSQSVLSVPRSWTDRWPAYSGNNTFCCLHFVVHSHVLGHGCVGDGGGGGVDAGLTAHAAAVAAEAVHVGEVGVLSHYPPAPRVEGILLIDVHDGEGTGCQGGEEAEVEYTLHPVVAHPHHRIQGGQLVQTGLRGVEHMLNTQQVSLWRGQKYFCREQRHSKLQKTVDLDLHGGQGPLEDASQPGVRKRSSVKQLTTAVARTAPREVQLRTSPTRLLGQAQTGQQADDQVQDEDQQVVLHSCCLISDGCKVHFSLLPVRQAQQLFDHVVRHLLHELQGLHIVTPRGEDLVQPGEVLVQAALHAAHQAGGDSGPGDAAGVGLLALLLFVFVAAAQTAQVDGETQQFSSSGWKLLSMG
ncbi:hypothetical protein F7725_014522 [Dissostichus mawsoni]|uniref:Uncharacterized protein n=1 Tax=Dissostichus mawsoni TaxID=36200 RepID=A0A7J5YW53_DISMA|nr:hypothetical protein F7725_014522 [Dissostichus mawsoni]